ncbi:hypothetical protein EVAR_45386_1 [Eumeta japonica]|uniref:Uncharacterized protein n=1 Tax=Eumeta variegata TaxID=151549 RepID=A0A4C1WRC6_EUMVA|nr:hypothetical protein EVAR_45386_1 [Eumeta japonica]
MKSGEYSALNSSLFITASPMYLGPADNHEYISYDDSYEKVSVQRHTCDSEPLVEEEHEDGGRARGDREGQDSYVEAITSFKSWRNAAVYRAPVSTELDDPVSITTFFNGPTPTCIDSRRPTYKSNGRSTTPQRKVSLL